MPRPSVSIGILRQYLFESGPLSQAQINEFAKEKELFWGIGIPTSLVLLEYKINETLVFDKETQKYNLSEKTRESMTEHQPPKGCER